MGTMEKMRRTSPYLLALFVIIFVGFMVASDADISNLIMQTTNPQTAEIGKVNDEKILYKDFEEKVQEQIDQQKQQAGEEEFEIDYNQIRSSIWTQTIEDILIKQQAKNLGLFVSDKEILDVLFDNPPDYLKKPFTDSSGRFLAEQYYEIITKPDIIYQRLPQDISQEEKKDIVETFKKDLIKIEQFLRDERLREGLRNVVSTATSFISPTFARQKYIEENSRASASFIKLDINSIQDNEIKVSDEEIQNYYEQNKRFYPQKPKRKLKFVAFKLVPSDKDTALANKNITKINNALMEATSFEERDTVFTKKAMEFQGETVEYTNLNDIKPDLLPYLSTAQVRQVIGPVYLKDAIYFFRIDDKRTGDNPVVKASHILINFGSNKDSAKSEAEKILRKAKSGEDFAELARTYSEDKGSGMQGGDLGYFGKGKMVKPFEDAAFSASVGSIVGPVESQFGYHIIKVVDKQAIEIKYSQIKIQPEISRATIRNLNRNAKDFKTRVDDGTPFDSVAKYYNLIARETDFFERDRPVLGSNYLSSLAFEESVGKTLEPLEIKGQGIVVAQIIDSRQAGFAPLTDVKDRIKQTLVRIKKLDALKTKANDLYNKIKNSGSLSNAVELAKPYEIRTANDIINNGIVPGFGQDIAFTNKVFLLPLNKISEPIRGETGYYIIEVHSRNIPDDKTVSTNLPDYLKNLRSAARSMGYYQWFQKIKEDANIEDLRHKFFREY